MTSETRYHGDRLSLPVLSRSWEAIEPNLPPIPAGQESQNKNKNEHCPGRRTVRTVACLKTFTDRGCRGLTRGAIRGTSDVH
jgi:hypothetical protein